ncbi:tRNA epoxyqueuosine(34) reductase QueG [Hydrogenovibrio sp. 3SP14C1]|uniref:tRNA epoxyqueuosine(34) reductase QueG n=1 Tax=Hydrogenovibrio sp. 3SP14C1 TaxID=3038774 RepID=UPI0024177EE8|nr:tRNA epoxyqueuosine(34) reductase QueG [Hydrogenovibrio sp. 3SP14C1]MDG4812547.1 tRNA epoxyqueuosine(34) reductase QueG [Hydrogenovibrio sp. 3SP14C1]
MQKNASKPMKKSADLPLYQLAEKIKHWAISLGFADIGITDIDLSRYESSYFEWLENRFHADMDYMVKHGTKRTRPQELEPGTRRVISVRMNYFDSEAQSPITQLQASDHAYISRYALHKDYHKLMRKRLQQLAEKINQAVEKDFHYRAFCDSAPVLERPLAEKAGLGFIGKNSLIIHPRAGSWFFLGELYTNLPLPIDPPFEKQGCGPCTACIQECPTQAIVADGVVDSRRCISYLTIENKGSIPESLREKMGNRIYGCDDCQLVCPWNKFTQDTHETAFKANSLLDASTLLELFHWSEKDFLKQLEGSPIRRIGFEQWQRNLCVALGNALETPALSQKIITALETHQTDSDLVNEHKNWALNRQKHFIESPEKTTRPGHFSTPSKPNKAKKYYLPKTIPVQEH